MLWIVIRMLAGRDLELNIKSTNPDSQQDTLDLPWSHRFKRGWDAGIDGLLGNRERWPRERLQHWADLVERYLSDEDQPGLLSADDLLTLICKEETNTFGLYAVDTGPLETQQERGPPYGLACYPRATNCNHSCLPNVSSCSNTLDEAKNGQAQAPARRPRADGHGHDARYRSRGGMLHFVH